MPKWLLVVLLALVAGWWLWPAQEPQIEPSSPPEPEEVVLTPQPQPILRQPEPEPVLAEPAPQPETPSPAEAAPQPELLPVAESLDNSDSPLRAVAAKLAPAFGRWLLPEHQLRKWVLAVDLLADGKLPKRYRPISYNMAPFAVKSVDKQYLSSDKNQHRADALIAALVAIEPERLLPYYRAWYPLLAQAYAEQGKGRDFDARLRAAMDQVLAVPPAPKNARLLRPSVFYRYADAELEARSDVEKLLWRLGDENREKLQAWLKVLRQEL